MNRAQALAILELPREQAVNLIIAIGEQAERWDVLQAQGAANTPISPTTTSSMTPVSVYLKPSGNPVPAGAQRSQAKNFHLFTELIKVDKLNASTTWKRFRKKLSRFLKDAVRLGQQRQQHSPPTYARRKAQLLQRLDELIAAAFDDADARRLIKRLRRHRGELLTFLDYEGVSPYNNHAEQQMRTAVHARKVSQQNRSLQGAKTHAIFLTLFRSAELQSLNPFEYVLQLAQATLAGQSTDTIAPDQLKKAA